MLAFKDSADGYYEFDDDAPPHWYAHLTPAAIKPPPPPAPQSTEALRRAAYQAEADPLFFKAQRGEAQQSDWLAKVAEIKSRFPE